MTRTLFASAALLLSALPVLAQAKPLTPPDVLGKAKTIQFTATLLKDGQAKEVSTAILAQPNKAFAVDTDAKTKTVDTVYASDGKTETEYRKSRAYYTKSAAPAQITAIESNALALSVMTEIFNRGAFSQYQRAPSDQPGVAVYSLPLGSHDGKTQTDVLKVDSMTGLPKSLSIVVTPSEHPGVPAEEIVFTDWKLNAPVDETTFAYTPPTDAKLYVAPMLLANGTAAPDFTVQDKDGKPVKLSDYRGKTVVLDFWATWCGPCQSSLPHTTEMAKKYAAKNVVVLAVNVWDSKAAFDGWLPKHPEYSALNFAIDPNPDQSKSVASALYGVSGIPTQYVIGPDGKIIKSIIGYEPGGHELEKALK